MLRLNFLFFFKFINILNFKQKKRNKICDFNLNGNYTIFVMSCTEFFIIAKFKIKFSVIIIDFVCQCQVGNSQKFRVNYVLNIECNIKYKDLLEKSYKKKNCFGYVQ